MMSSYLFLTFGLLLMVCEMMFGSFYLLFCGLGLLVVGVFSFFVDISWYFQLSLSVIIALMLIFALRKPLINSINSKDGVKDDFLNETGVGVVKEGMVYFKGTLWHFDSKPNLKDGDKVEVVGTSGNKVILKDKKA